MIRPTTDCLSINAELKDWQPNATKQQSHYRRLTKTHSRSSIKGQSPSANKPTRAGDGLIAESRYSKQKTAVMWSVRLRQNLPNSPKEQSHAVCFCPPRSNKSQNPESSFNRMQMMMWLLCFKEDRGGGDREEQGQEAGRGGKVQRAH